MARELQPLITGYVVVQDEQRIARVYRDHLEAAWIVIADCDRFETQDDLPAEFGRRFVTRLPDDFAAVEHFFGLSEASESATDAALIQAAHRRGADVAAAA